MEQESFPDGDVASSSSNELWYQEGKHPADPEAGVSSAAMTTRGYYRGGDFVGDEEREDMVAELMNVTGIQDVDFAREFLQGNGWQLAISVNAYQRMGRFSTGDSRHLPLYIQYCRNATDVGI